MSNIRCTYTNIKGHRVESGRRTFKFEERHFSREANSPKSQNDINHQHPSINNADSTITKQ